MILLNNKPKKIHKKNKKKRIICDRLYYMLNKLELKLNFNYAQLNRAVAHSNPTQLAIT